MVVFVYGHIVYRYAVRTYGYHMDGALFNARIENENKIGIDF